MTIPPEGDSRGFRFALLALGEVGSRVIAFGVTVYMARTLGASAYGVVAFAMAVLLYLSCIVDGGLEMLGVRDIAEGPSRIPILLPSLVVARLLIALGLGLVVAAAGLLVMPQPEGAVIAAYAVSLTATAAGTKWVHLGLERPGRVAVAAIGGAVLTALLIVFFVHDAGDVGRWPAAQFAGDALTALLLLLFVSRAGLGLAVALDWSVVMPVFRRSWPLVLHALLGLVIFNSDFVFLRVFRDAATVGRYAVAYTLVSFLLNLGVAYAFTLLPAMTRLVGQREPERELYGRAMAEAMAGALPVAAGGWLLGGALIVALFGNAYAPAEGPLMILLASVPVALVRCVAQSALIARGRQHDVLRSVTWAAALNVALNFALIPRWGMLGAAWATLATEVTRTTLSLVYIGREGVALPPLRRFWRVAAGCAVMALAVRFAPVPGLWLRLALGIAVYAAALALTGALRLGPGRRPQLAL